jgi:pilus assembly protein Flp/PilA
MIGKLVDRAKWLYEDEEGATMVEYALLLALIAVVSITIITTLGGKVKTTYTSASGAMP